MRRPLPSLVLAFLFANSCFARPRQQSPPQTAASHAANTDAAAQKCFVSPALADAARGDNSRAGSGAPDGEITERLVKEFNSQARAVSSIDAHVQVIPAPGPSYGDQAKNAQEVDALLFAERPGSLRFLAQAPFVGKTLFDLASDGDKFQIALPSRHEFLAGQYGNAVHSSNPLENIRPQHLLDALIWPELSDEETVRLQPPSGKGAASSYTLIVSRKNGAGLKPERLITFDGRTLQVQGMEIYGANGNLVSEIRFDQWMNASAEPGASMDVCYPQHIEIRRPEEDYRLEIQVTRIRLNEKFGRERFHLAIAPGMRPVNLDSKDPKPNP